MFITPRGHIVKGVLIYDPDWREMISSISLHYIWMKRQSFLPFRTVYSSFLWIRSKAAYTEALKTDSLIEW